MPSQVLPPDVTAPWRPERETAPPLGGLLPCVLVGVAVGVAAIAATAMAPKDVVKAVLGVGLLIGAFVSPWPRQALLFLWVPSLTYNRNYFLDFLGNYGSYGLYWNPSDVFLAAILGYWLYERVVLGKSKTPVGPALWPIYLPFVAGSLIAVADAIHVDWAIFDMARVARVALILWYVRYNVREKEWVVCLAGLGAAIVIQALQGVIYVATGRELGLAFFLGAGAQAEAYKAMVGGTTMAFRRAEGTLGHPNTLALYLLYTTPLFVALALVRGPTVRRLASGAVAVAGFAALAATLSRTGWLLGAFEAVLLVSGLVALRQLRVRTAIAVTVVGLWATLAVAFPFADQIHERLTSDFGHQIDFRANYDRIALDIWQESPLTGVGPNNYSGRLEQFDLPEVKVMTELGDAVRTGLKLKVTAWVHNIYLLILGETGLVGFAGFLVFIGGAAWFAVRGIVETRGVWRSLAFALLVGMTAGMLHGLQESALWIDPVLYTFALLVGLTANLRGLGASSTGKEEPA